MLVRAARAHGRVTPEVCRDHEQREAAVGRGRPPSTSPSCWCGHSLGWPLYLAQFTNLLVIYWIFLASTRDAVALLHHDRVRRLAGLGVHVPSGAFGTTWGKRRFGRFGEHLIGILLASPSVRPLPEGIGPMVDPRSSKKATTAAVGTTAPGQGGADHDRPCLGHPDPVHLAEHRLGRRLVPGDQGQRQRPRDARNVSKDVLMSVWAAFWTSASIAWYRQKWAVDKLPNLFQYAWMAQRLLLLWMPVFHSAAYLSDEIDVAFSDGKGTTDTPRLIIYILIYAFSAIWTAVLLFDSRPCTTRMPKRPRAGKRAVHAERETRPREAHRGAEAAQGAGEARRAWADGVGPGGRPRRVALKFDLSGMSRSVGDGAGATAAQDGRGLHAAAAVAVTYAVRRDPSGIRRVCVGARGRVVGSVWAGWLSFAPCAHLSRFASNHKQFSTRPLSRGE